MALYDNIHKDSFVLMTDFMYGSVLYIPFITTLSTELRLADSFSIQLKRPSTNTFESQCEGVGSYSDFWNQANVCSPSVINLQVTRSPKKALCPPV